MDDLKKLGKVKNLIGNTPLIKIFYKYNGEIRFLYAKLEWYNLTGSIKDRPAYYIIKNAIKSKKLKPNQLICEVTSGNMGISICALGKVTNHRVIVCMPKDMSEERKKLLKLYGAQLELVDNFEQAFEKAKYYQDKGAFLPHQFENKNNTLAHYQTTASEIIKKLKKVPCFVSGVGTGGTLMGVGTFLKDKCDAKIIAIDPKESKLLTCGKSFGKHQIQGISDEIIPKLYNKSLVDRIVLVSSVDAINMSKKLAKCLGLGVGISSGANFLGCVLSNINGATTVFPDDNKKYISLIKTQKKESILTKKIDLLGFEIV